MIRVLVALIGLLGALPVVAQPWEPYNELGDLYPAYAITVANLVPDADDRQDKALLGDLNGVMGITFTPARPDTRVKLEIRCDNSLKLFETAVIDVVTPAAGEEYLIRPFIPFDHSKLASIRQPVTTYITYILTIDGHRQLPRTERLRVRSVNDCPYALVDDDKHATPIDFMFAAYVNEDHPWIQDILQEAIRKKYVTAFVGYKTDEIGVYQQVMAIWRVLQDRGIRYSSIPTVSPESSGVLSQHVRMLDESIRYAQSNCVDGTVLLASILRKIALNPILVVLPGHMFVGFDLDAGGEQQAYLETTLLGAGTRKTDGAKSRLYKTMLGNEPGQKAQTATQSFVGAIESGNATFLRSKWAIRQQKDGYGLIDLAIARQAGVAPILYVEPKGGER